MNVKMNSQDVFYFYNASINPLKLIEENVVKNLQPTDGYFTNAFGVLIDPKFFPTILTGREGTVEEIPIPANWHADIAEFGAALRAVELAHNSFTMIELGCGWGCWMNITGLTAKRKGLNVHLIGVEGDEGHVGFAKESLSSNGFKPSEYSLYHGVAAATSGVALFPKDDQPGVNWGAAPKFDVDPKEAQKLVDSDAYVRLEQFSLERISENFERIDLLHVDIQGGEGRLITQSMPFLSGRVSYLLIGTHSRQIEGILFDCLLKAGWVLEIERPALLNLDKEPLVSVDGVQGWRNPKLLPNVDIVDSNGSIKIISDVNEVKSGEEVYLHVEIINQSPTDWLSQGRHPVHISYHWLDTQDNVVVFEGERTKFLESKLQSGQSKQQLVKVVAPSSGGTYQIVMKLVQEGVRWFEAPTFIGEARTITVITDCSVLVPAKAIKSTAPPLEYPKVSQAQPVWRKLQYLRNYLRTLRDMFYRAVL
jgi:hypothetical protein